MKYCHNCGAPLVDDVRFCTACGSPLDPPETEPAMPESAVMPEMPEPAPEMPVMPGEALPPEPPKKRKKRIWLWILLPVVVLALAAGALYYFLVWNAPEARVQRVAEDGRCPRDGGRPSGESDGLCRNAAGPAERAARADGLAHVRIRRRNARGRALFAARQCGAPPRRHG